MWLENLNVRQTRDILKMPYLTVNLRDGNPAFRIRAVEEMLEELNWTEDDFVNVYVDREKIILKKDNASRQFPVSIYRNKNVPYGYLIYSRMIKEVLENTEWEEGKYKVLIIPEGRDKIVMCLKKNSYTIVD